VLLAVTACVHAMLVFAPVGTRHAGVDDDTQPEDFSGGAT
jgi:hypothetical protein